MSTVISSHADAGLARGRSPARAASKKPDRDFHSVAAMVMLVVALVGFQPFYLKGEGMGGRTISAQLFTLVLAHGACTTAWFVLFLVQALLIRTRNLRVHMRVGWGAAAVALGIMITGFMVAVQSVRLNPEIAFWGMAYRQFLLIMLVEIALFTCFVVAGVLSRKRPARHRAMMLLAGLSILAGATVRMPFLFPIFGQSGWMGIFGPIFTIGAAFLVARPLFMGAVDRWFAAGYSALIVVYVAACAFAVSGAWNYLAKTFFNI